MNLYLAMEIWHIVFICWCHLTVLYAVKEDASHGSPGKTGMDSGRLRQIMKRLGIDDKGVNIDSLMNELNEKDDEDACKTNKVTRNSIIKSSESISNGAEYVTLEKGIPSFTQCATLCCDNPHCDTAIYQENKEQRCFLFACKGHCKFTDHSYYSVATVERPASSSRAEEHAEEDELEKLHGASDSSGSSSRTDGDGQSSTHRQQQESQSEEEHSDTAHHHGGSHHEEEQEKPPTTAAPTARTPKPFVAPHTAALSAFCTSDVSCEDPNAGCLRDACQCRDGYYSKEGLCRKTCPSSYFECLKLGSLSRGPECVPQSQVCDSYMECADGSDELNCRDSAGNIPGRLSNQPYESRPSSWPDQADNGNDNNYNNNNNNDYNNQGNGQSVQGQQFVQPGSHQQPGPLQTGQILNPPGGNGQMGKGASALHENLQPHSVPPSVRPNSMPAQHAASGMGDGNYLGAKSQRPLTNQNANTNNMQPSDYSRNNQFPNADANPAVNPNPPVDVGDNSFDMKSSRMNPPVSGNSVGSPNNPSSQNTDNGQFPSHQESTMGRHPQQTDQRLSQTATSNRAYTEGGSSEGIPISNPASQSQRKTPMSSQIQHPQQSPSRTVNRTSESSSMNMQKSDDRIENNESHYLSKPSVPSSLSSSSSSSLHKAQMESQKTALHQGQRLPSSAGQMPLSSHSQAGVKPGQYKSPNSLSSASSSLSNQRGSTNWLDNDNDMYVPYGSNNPKLPSGRQLSPSQYYGQQQPQYYRPYSTDSLNSLPSSLLGGGRSQDDFSQFGGSYLEQQKPPSQAQYRLNNGNSGYLNYPDSSYNSQFPSPNRYNFGGDFSSSNYQDPDFYLPMGNPPPAYHPDGLYEDNPTDASHSDTMRKDKDDNQGAVSHTEPEKHEPLNQKALPKEDEASSKKTQAPTPEAGAATSAPSPMANSKTTVAPHSAKANHSDQAKAEVPHHTDGGDKHVFLSREKVIIASSSSEAEGPIIALSLGLAFTIILIGLLGCRLRNMKHRLRKGRPLNSNEADYLINGMYL